ncbi:MAG TPA: prepilin-type N-terminal cleavage/methylation domain-containing protein [Candidatus Saccharimonadales bacterium]|nr:prepilin-type N-terminal cleavage/methylation domain-containing protein [Candidatus Saccharimonadales bacterium]
MSQRGFTLVELIVVGTLGGVLLIAAALLLHPKDYSPERRDAERRLGVAVLMQAVSNYVADKGALPEHMPAKEQIIGSEEDMYDLCKVLVPHYLDHVPIDPIAGAEVSDENCAEADAVYDSGYTIQRHGDREITIAGSVAEREGRISLTHSFKF